MKHLGAVVAGVALALGAVAYRGPVAPVMPPVAAREFARANVGDTIVPRFSIRIDTVMSVVGSSIVVRHCGTGTVFLRTWKGNVQLSADTVSFTVPCAASVTVCLFPDPDSMKKYKVSGDTSIDPKLVPCRRG